jgi:hypothetical protein
MKQLISTSPPQTIVVPSGLPWPPKFRTDIWPRGDLINIYNDWTSPLTCGFIYEWKLAGGEINYYRYGDWTLTQAFQIRAAFTGPANYLGLFGGELYNYIIRPNLQTINGNPIT